MSPYKFYPDAYQNLIVAHNISVYKSVVGFLGDKGMLYPDFFMWTRPVYPLLINLAQTIFHDGVKAAAFVSLIMGIFSVILIFLMISILFKNKNLGLCASLLLALSFSQIVWGGFIYTETTGNFLMIMFLLSLFYSVRHTHNIFGLCDMVSGMLFSAAVFSRYEYVIILLPVILYIATETEKPLKYLLNIFIGFALVTCGFITSIYPRESLLLIIMSQTGPNISIAMKLISASALCFIVYAVILKNLKENIKNYIGILFFIILLVTVITIQLLNYPEGLAGFMRHDFVITLTFLIGLFHMLADKKFRSTGYFVLLSSVSLYLFYLHSNPAMERYGTHLLPFLLIPAGFGLYKIFKYSVKYKIILPVAAFALIFQIILSYQGIKKWDTGVWFRVSYEEKNAGIVASMIRDKNILLIASYPEPYYYFTKHSTYSITDKYPFIYIDSSLDNRNVMIIQDMGMYDLFPNFSKILDSQLSKYRIYRFDNKETYHYAHRTIYQSRPTILYIIPLPDLRKILDSSKT